MRKLLIFALLVSCLLIITLSCGDDCDCNSGILTLSGSFSNQNINQPQRMAISPDGKNLYSVEMTLAIASLTGSFSYRITEKISAGIGITGYTALYTRKDITPSVITNMELYDFSSFGGVGGNLGIFYKASEKLSFGFNIKIPAAIKIKGISTIDGLSYTTEADLRLPAFISAGAAYKVNQYMILTFAATFANWSSVKEIAIRTTTAPNIIATNTTATAYKDTISLGFGMETQMTDKFDLRAGLEFTPNATLNQGTDTSLTPDVSQIMLACGTSYNFTSNFVIDLSIHYTIGFGDSICCTKYNRNIFSIMTGLRLKL